MRIRSLDPGAWETLRRLGVGDASADADVVIVPGDWEPARVEAIRRSGRVRVEPIRADSIEAILDEILRIGELVGRVGHAESLMVEVRERMHRAWDFVNPYAEPPTLALIARAEPRAVAGGFLAQLVERAGARPAFNPTQAAPGSGSASGPQMAYRRSGPEVSISDAILSSSPPALVVLAPADASLEDAVIMGNDLARRGLLPARSAAVDPALVHAGGPFIADASEWLVGWIHGVPALMPASIAWAPIGG